MPVTDTMKRVAVFGNAGGGKSTLAKKLAELTRLPVYPLDLIQFKAGGGKVPYEDYLKAHGDLVCREEWIIDGFGCVASAWERFSAADTLIYVDLPLSTHYWWVTKRFLKGPSQLRRDGQATVRCGAARSIAIGLSVFAIAI
jgi:adenylate kinase family enzyme